MNDYIVLSKNKKIDIQVSDNSEIIINEKKFRYELIQLNNSIFRLLINQKVYDISAVKNGSDRFTVSFEGYTFEMIVRTALQERASKVIEHKCAENHLREVKAPMPGMVLKIKKKVGDKINMGESVLILEAMKMENDIKSPSTGVIRGIFVTEASAVEKGTKLFSFK